MLASKSYNRLSVSVEEFQSLHPSLPLKVIEDLFVVQIVVNWELDVSIVQHQHSVALHLRYRVVVPADAVDELPLLFPLDLELREKIVLARHKLIHHLFLPAHLALIVLHVVLRFKKCLIRALLGVCPPSFRSCGCSC